LLCCVDALVDKLPLTVIEVQWLVDAESLPTWFVDRLVERLSLRSIELDNDSLFLMWLPECDMDSELEFELEYESLR